MRGLRAGWAAMFALALAGCNLLPQRTDTPEIKAAGEQMKAQKLRIKLPPNPAPIVIDHLNEMGLTEAAGMGAAPLSWQTLFAWQQVTGVLLPAWEARLIRHLSSAYLTESRKAESENCPAPWRGEITQSDRDAEDRLLREALGI